MFYDRFIKLCEDSNIKPNSAVLIKIADYFNVSVDYLLGRTDDPDIRKK